MESRRLTLPLVIAHVEQPPPPPGFLCFMLTPLKNSRKMQRKGSQVRVLVPSSLAWPVSPSLVRASVALQGCQPRLMALGPAREVPISVPASGTPSLRHTPAPDLLGMRGEKRILKIMFQIGAIKMKRNLQAHWTSGLCFMCFLRSLPSPRPAKRLPGVAA